MRGKQLIRFRVCQLAYEPSFGIEYVVKRETAIEPATSSLGSWHSQTRILCTLLNSKLRNQSKSCGGRLITSNSDGTYVPNSWLNSKGSGWIRVASLSGTTSPIKVTRLRLERW